MKQLYECDPKKHTKCNKNSCFHNGGPCHLTTDKIYSTDGRPVSEQTKLFLSGVKHKVDDETTKGK